MPTMQWTSAWPCPVQQRQLLKFAIVWHFQHGRIQMQGRNLVSCVLLPNQAGKLSHKTRDKRFTLHDSY